MIATKERAWDIIPPGSRNLFNNGTVIENMKLVRIIAGEILLLGASILIFRSVWTLLDQCFGSSDLWPMLIIGIIVTIAGLVIINHEVECEMKKVSSSRSSGQALRRLEFKAVAFKFCVK